MKAIEIELLVIRDCPHQAAAEDLSRTALLDIGLPADFQVVTITDEADRDFAGSPAFCADGADLFPVVGNQPD